MISSGHTRNPTPAGRRHNQAHKVTQEREMLTRKQFRAIWREMARSESGRADSERIRQLIVDAGLLAVRRLPNVLSSYNGTSIPWDVRRAAEDEAAERLCRQWASTNAPELLGGAVHR